MNKLMDLIKDETGATAVEYGLIAALIAIAAIASLAAVGTGLSSNFSKAAGNMSKSAR